MAKKKLLYILLSIIFTIFFIYVLFPYSLVKEVLINELQDVLNQKNIGIELQAESLSSYWFTGIHAKKLQIISQHNLTDALNIEDLTVRMSIFPLFVGRVNIGTHIKIEEGQGAIFVSLSLSDLISQKIHIKELKANFDNFKLNDFFKQLIYVIKNNNDPNLALVIPVIANSSIGGFLDGEVDYENTDRYTSKMNLKIKNAFLDINNADLNIPKQNFTAASINMEYNNNFLTIKKETRFVAQNISILASGNIKNADKYNKNQIANVKLEMLLSGQIEQNFGFLLPQLLKCPPSSSSGGIMNVQLSGPLDNLSCHQ